MWHVLLVAPLVAPLLWHVARPLCWVLILLPLLTIYAETYPSHDPLPIIYPLEWPDKPPTLNSRCAEDAVTRLAHFIVRDFIEKWHNILIEDTHDEESASFPLAVTQLLCDVLHRVLTRAEQVDVTTLLMQRVFPTLREHIEKYRLAQNSLQGFSLSKDDAAFHDWFMATKYQQGELHPAVGNTSSLNTKESEHAHLRKLMNRFINAFTQDTACLGRVEAALVREVLACSLLYPVIDLITNPDWIHLQIASKAEKRSHELEQMDRVRESLNASAPEPSLLRKPALHDYPASSPRQRRRTASWRVRASRMYPYKPKKGSKYEHFLVRIESTQSLLDLRRIRHELLNEIQRMNKEMSKDPSNVRLGIYVGKLKSALDIAEKRTAELGCNTDLHKPIHDHDLERSQELARMTLDEVLRNSASLSCLLEFMDLRGRDVLLRFWIFVNAFKDPLEQVELDLPLLDAKALMREVVHDPDADMHTSTQTLKEFMASVLRYCTSPLVPVRDSCREILEAFLALEQSMGVRERGLLLVRQCVLLIQADVMQIMLDQDWEPFRASHLYVQAADQVRRSHTLAEKTNNATFLEWDTESDNSDGEDLSSPFDPGHQKEERIPLRYSFLMGTGNGTKTEDPALFRKPLFENAPLFVDDPASTSMTKIWQSTLPEHSASMAPASMSADTSRHSDQGMDLAWLRHQQTCTRLRELRCQCEQLHQHRDKLDTLINKTELTGASMQEMQLWQSSRKAIERDIRTTEWEAGYLEHLLHQHGHIFDAKYATHVAIKIKDTEECKDQAGHTFILYHILVRMFMTVDGNSDTEYIWVVTRRYSAFRELHQSLKHQFRSIWACESLFPGKKLMGSMNTTFIESRRRSLERYLIVCQNCLTCRPH